MHSATLLTLLSASLVVASPLHHFFHKRAYVTDIVTDIVTVVVTATGPAVEQQAAVVTVSAPAKQVHVHTHHTTVIVPASPAAAPATTNTPAVVVVTQQAPQTSTSSAAAVVAVVAPTSSAAPVSSVAPSSTAVAASSPTDYSSTAVFNHNQHRANHSASDMAWNQTLADWAEITAKTCVFAHDMAEGTKNYGQNIAAYGSSAGVPSAANALANAITEAWYYGEVNEFPFGEASPPTNGFDFMHFSQAVWKGSQTVGCATVQCPGNSVLGSADYDSMYTVCNYFPAGNILGSFDSQVSPSDDKVPTLNAAIVI